MGLEILSFQNVFNSARLQAAVLEIYNFLIVRLPTLAIGPSENFLEIVPKAGMLEENIRNIYIFIFRKSHFKRDLLFYVL